MENNKNKKSVKFQGDMLNFCDLFRFLYLPQMICAKYKNLNKTTKIQFPANIGICSTEVLGNVVMRMGTQQQYNNQDSYVNEFVSTRTCTLLCSSQVYYLKNLETNYFFFYLLSLIMCERVGKINC